ncbi:hypothetical protein TRFO_30148 [Tritrichomonas foetus]|uniref:Uncharacterized protein n=1 Tax=Tritrichomonas foetus TaxID=1144522 RepID=A0A1J4JUM1_9EUKA|nr:hypothetical protein TRFO_30148 [Tritrichomonas foetus]|eukprot:OHT02699.1 hypothetical protein TRFO_30148 [Tritrichomonas foetus]
MGRKKIETTIQTITLTVGNDIINVNLDTDEKPLVEKSELKKMLKSVLQKILAFEGTKSDVDSFDDITEEYSDDLFSKEKDEEITEKNQFAQIMFSDDIDYNPSGFNNSFCFNVFGNNTSPASNSHNHNYNRTKNYNGFNDENIFFQEISQFLPDFYGFFKEDSFGKYLTDEC